MKVTGTKDGFSTTTKTSAGKTVRGTLEKAVPAITGTAKVGSVLTAEPGDWGPDPVTLSYQWYHSGIPISSATAATYTPGGADAGRTITVKVTGTRPGYTTAWKTSAGTARVAKGTLTASVPAITGAAKVGSVLTAEPGAWGPAPVALTYRWYRGDTLISGATAATYKVRSGDLGRSVTVKVTGSEAGYSSTSRTSAGTASVAKGILSASVPIITGTATVGSTLTAVPSAWGLAPVALTYKWYRSHVPISDARASTYQVRAGDRGRTITVKVTGSKAGYSSTSRTSAGTKASG